MKRFDAMGDDVVCESEHGEFVRLADVSEQLGQAGKRVIELESAMRGLPCIGDRCTGDCEVCAARTALGL